MNRRFYLHICVISAVSLSLSGARLSAAVFNVASGDVAGLNAAITIANGNAQNDTINLAPGGSYILTVAQNVVNGPTGLAVIQSDGGHALLINGNNALLQRSTANGTPDFRILNVAGGNATIVRLTISNGRAFGDNFADANSGGGIYNTGNLSLRNCIITGNAAVARSGGESAGGGIFNFKGTLTLTGCAIVTNSASGTFDFTGGEGGGLYNYSGTVTLTDTTIDANSASRTGDPNLGGSGGSGGGMVNADGLMEIRNCTISSNLCTFAGAGMTNLSNSSNKSLTMVNSTISNNVAQNSGGGGIFNQTTSLNLTSTTISGNVAPGGGGIYTFGSTVRIHNTIVAGNNATSSGSDIYAFEAVASQGHNLIGVVDNSSGWTASDSTGSSGNPLDPMLLPLANNGGLTQTRALQPSSAAINAGDNAVLKAPDNVTSDQQLFARKAGAAVDIGAFEYGAAPVLPADLNGDSFSDYLLFNPSTRRTALWYLRSNAFLGGTFGPTLPADWTVACVTDIDLDGGRDLVLTNSTTRQTAVWFLRNATFLVGKYGPTLPSGWKLVACADVDADGQQDYVLFNPTTRQSAVWFLSGTNFVRGAFGPTLPSGWTLVDGLDFNGNAKPDYLLFNPSTRQTAVWYLNGTALVGGAYGPTLPSGWTLQGASDFDADSKPDYVLFEASTRRTAIWYLNGTSFVGGVLAPTLPTGYALASP